MLFIRKSKKTPMLICSQTPVQGVGRLSLILGASSEVNMPNKRRYKDGRNGIEAEPLSECSTPTALSVQSSATESYWQMP